MGSFNLALGELGATPEFIHLSARGIHLAVGPIHLSVRRIYLAVGPIHFGLGSAYLYLRLAAKLSTKNGENDEIQ